MTERRLYIGSIGPFFYDDTDVYPTPQDAGDQGFGDGVLMNTVVTDGAILAASFKLWDTDATHTLELKWNEDDSGNRILNFLVAGGNRSLTLNEDFTIGGGYNVTITALGQANTLTLNESLTIGDGNSGTITFGNASDVLTVNETLTLAGASGKTLTLTENLTIGDGTDITIAGVTQANTLTLHESLTIGDGNNGTITFSAASKTVTVAGSCTLNDWFDQAVKAASNVSFSTIALTGGQLAFPATQNASADPNTQDDYEEGYHTATITCATSGNYTLDAGSDTLAYTKIGRICYLQGYLSITGENAPNGQLRVSLPFTTDNLTENADLGASFGVIRNHGDAGIENVYWIVSPNVAYSNLANLVDDGSVEDIDHDRVDAAFAVYVNMNYITA